MINQANKNKYTNNQASAYLINANNEKYNAPYMSKKPSAPGPSLNRNQNNSINLPIALQNQYM